MAPTFKQSSRCKACVQLHAVLQNAVLLTLASIAPTREEKAGSGRGGLQRKGKQAGAGRLSEWLGADSNLCGTAASPWDRGAGGSAEDASTFDAGSGHARGCHNPITNRPGPSLLP